MDGIRIGGPYMEGDDGYWPVLDEFQSLESFHAFAHYPAILDMLEQALRRENPCASAEYRKNYVPRKTLNTQRLHTRISSISEGLRRPIPHGYRLVTAQKTWAD